VVERAGERHFAHGTGRVLPAVPRRARAVLPGSFSVHEGLTSPTSE
jgi:hypothetical protein